jgi:hypothetical protein
MGGGAVRRWGRCPIRRRHEGCRRVRRVAEKEGGGRRSTTSCGGRNQIAYSRERVTGSALGRSFYELVYFPLMYFLGHVQKIIKDPFVKLTHLVYLSPKRRDKSLSQPRKKLNFVQKAILLAACGSCPTRPRGDKGLSVG